MAKEYTGPYVSSIRKSIGKTSVLPSLEFDDSLSRLLTANKKLIRSLDWKYRRKILQNAHQPFIRAAKANNKDDTGLLDQAIGTFTFRNNQKFVYAGVKGKKRIRKKKFDSTISGNNKTSGRVTVSESGKSVLIDVFYAKFVEFGFTHIAWPEKGKKIKYREYRKGRLKEIKGRFFIKKAHMTTKSTTASRVKVSLENHLKKHSKTTKIYGFV